MKKLIAAILIILMISLLSITSFAQVLPEGYPPSIADQLQASIEDNLANPGNKDIMEYTYTELLDYNWSLSFNTDINSKVTIYTHTFKDGSSITIKYFKNCINILNTDKLFMYVVKR